MSTAQVTDGVSSIDIQTESLALVASQVSQAFFCHLNQCQSYFSVKHSLKSSRQKLFQFRILFESRRGTETNTKLSFDQFTLSMKLLFTFCERKANRETSNDQRSMAKSSKYKESENKKFR